MLTPPAPLPLSELIAVDLVPLYPQSLTPTFVSALRDYYIATYSDRFFSPQAPAWFRVYTWMEALYHIPLSIWALKGLWQGTLHLDELCDWLKIITSPFSSGSISKFIFLIWTHLCNSSLSKTGELFSLSLLSSFGYTPVSTAIIYLLPLLFPTR